MLYTTLISQQTVFYCLDFQVPLLRDKEKGPMTASGYWQLLLSRAVSWSFKLETLGHCFFHTAERQTAGAEKPVSRVVIDDYLFFAVSVN